MKMKSLTLAAAQSLFPFALTLLPIASAWASPPWCVTTPPHDEVYKNYVGRATAPSPEEAFRKATVQARKEAVEENFGFQFHVQSSGNTRAGSHLDTESMVTQDFEERSKLVRLEKFERVLTYSAEDPAGPGHTACVWYHYPVTALEKEQARLAKLKPEDAVRQTELVIQGSAADSKRGVLRVTSVPPGAAVIIDGKTWGETPLELRGKLKEGKHDLVLDHPDHERIKMDFEVFEGDLKRIDQILTPAKGTLRIVTEPEGATVLIDGKVVGTTPLEEVKLTAGRNFALVVEHPEAKREERKITLSRNEPLEVKVELKLKMAHLGFAVQPRGATVRLDTVKKKPHKKKGDTYELDLRAGDYMLRIEHDDYEPYEQSLTLRGGEALELGTISLTRTPPKPNYAAIEAGYKRAPASYSLDSPAPRSEPESRSSFDPRWVLSLAYENTSSPVVAPDLRVSRYGLSVEYLPHLLIGFRGSYFYGYSNQSYKDGKLEYEGHTAEVGIPLHLPWFNIFGKDTLFAEAVASATVFCYTLTPNASKATETPAALVRSTGIDAGYRILSNPDSKTGTWVWGLTLRYGMDLNNSATGGYTPKRMQKLGAELIFGF